jgi:tripartite motif-containing protein 71
MNDSNFDVLARALSDGLPSRRGLMRGLAGLAAIGLDSAEAKKRKKKGKKRKKGKKKRKGGNDGGGGECNETICEGQCVDLATDPSNCGACGRGCDDEDGETCVEGQCVAIFGRQGTGDGEFQDPIGIALNAEDQAFVTDFGNNRLVLLNGGEFENADVVDPVGVAVNQFSGQIYVTDPAFQAVARLDRDGIFLNRFGGQDSGEGQFQDPFGVAVDPFTGQVFVADTGNHRIQRFNAIGQPLSLFGEAGDGEGQLNSPRGVVVNGKREVIIADAANNRIQVFERRVVEDDFTFVRAFGSAGSGDGQFSTPIAVAVDGDDNIFVADLDNHRVQQFTSDGRFVTAFGSPGSNPGQFGGPFGIAISERGEIFVVDRGNHRVQRFRLARAGK